MFQSLAHRIYLQLFIALALGTALGGRWPLAAEVLQAQQGLVWAAVAGLVVLWWLYRNAPEPWCRLPGFICLAFFGYINASMVIALTLTAPLRAHTAWEPQLLTGRVASMPKYQRGHLRFLLRVERVGEAPGEAAPGLCYAYVKCDEAPAVCLGERIALRANLSEVEPPANRGQFNYRGYLLQRGTVLTAYAVQEADLARLDGRAPPVWAWLSRLRALLAANLGRALPERYRELALSVVFGDKIADLPAEIEENFRRAGLTHILVASGTQVSLLIMLLGLLNWRIAAGASWRSIAVNLLHFLLTAALVLIYAAVSGFETSIVRAVAMGMLVLTGRLLRREVDGMTSLAQSGLILIILNPLSLFSPGFQLSFGATFGLIYTAGVCFPLVERWPRWRRAAAQTLITTGGAQLFVGPLLAAGFQQVSLWGFLSNLIAIPTAFALLLTGGIASLGVSAVPWLGWALSQAVTGLCWFLDHIASFFAALPGSNLAVPSLPLWWIVLFTGLLLLGGEWIKALPAMSATALQAARATAVGAALLLAAGVLWWLLVPRPGLSVLALQGGEAYLWRPLSGRAVLIARQTGLSRKHNAEAVAAAVRWRGINRLDGIVWLDGAPPDNPFPDTPARPYLPGEPLPAAWDIAWFGGEAETRGALLRLCGSDIWLLWDVPAATPAPPPAPLAIPAALSPAAFDSQPALVIVGRDVWQGLAPEQREGLRSLRGTLVFGSARTYYDSSECACALASELDVTPGRQGLKLSLYRSRTP